jgi:lipopolysaccharide heptosyltransferase I
MLDFEPRRIVLIKPSALGDIVHSLPVLTALRQRFAGAHIAWVVNRLYEPLLRDHPHLDAVIPFERAFRNPLAAAAKFAGLLHRLRQARFDLSIDLQGLLRTGVMCRATGARARLGLQSAREGARWFYTHVADDIDGVDHAVDRYWRAAEMLGAGAGDKRFVLPLDPACRAWARTLLAEHPRPWLAVGVGARWLTKRWPPQHFAALTQHALDAFGGSAIFVGAPDEAALAEQTATQLRGRSLNLAGRTSLPQLAALLAEIDVMLANDTGPLHLAVALGRPVVAPYTCTVVARTGPYGQAHHAVATGVWCAGSCLKRCDRLDCMRELTPERLRPILHNLLSTWQHNRLSA